LLTRALLYFLVQVVIAYTVYGVLFEIRGWFIERSINSLSWGISLRLAALIYIGISGTTSVLISRAKNVRETVYILSCGYFLFAILFVGEYDVTPTKTLILLIAALLGMSSALMTSNYVRRWSRVNQRI